MHRTSAEEERVKGSADVVNPQVRLQRLQRLQHFFLSICSANSQVPLEALDGLLALLVRHVDPTDPVVWLCKNGVNFKAFLKVLECQVSFFHLYVEQCKL